MATLIRNIEPISTDVNPSSFLLAIERSLKNTGYSFLDRKQKQERNKIYLSIDEDTINKLLQN